MTALLSFLPTLTFSCPSTRAPLSSEPLHVFGEDYEEAVAPLLQTVVDILKLQLNRDAHRHGEQRPADDQEHVRQSFVDGSTAGSNVSPSPTEAMFLLSFARRNVSIDRVLKEAETLGLKWWVPDDFQPVCTSENVYMMSLDRERGVF